VDQLVSEGFERVAALVVGGRLDDSLAAPLARHANLTPEEAAWVLSIPADVHPMRVLQGAASVFTGTGDFGFGDADAGLYVAAKLPAVIVTRLADRAVSFDTHLDYTRRFLYALRGAADPQHVRALNTAQILQLEHSFNAGTFAARVVASTLAPVTSAMSAGIGALSGPLHGGADQAVLEIADGLRSVDAARCYVDKAVEAGEKVPGMGHREYRVRDPRAAFMQHWAQQLSTEPEHALTYDVLLTIESRFRELMAARGKPLHANVEFYKGLVYRVLGLPNDYFTAGFAMARVFGYVAHFLESRVDNRIFRPAAAYVGV
jgi:citrate synthase